METFLAPKRVAYANQSIAENPDKVQVDKDDSSENAEIDESEEICKICQQIDPPEKDLDDENMDDDTIGWVSCDNCFKWFHIICIEIRS